MIRRTARWQVTVDERLLEHLRDADASTIPMLSRALGVPTGILRDRLRMLAQVELVAVDQDGRGERLWFELSYWGQLYLEGDYDPGLRARPTPHAGYRAVA